MRGKFPKTCKHFNSPKIDIKSYIYNSYLFWSNYKSRALVTTGIFSHNWGPSYDIKLHFEIFEGSTREISTWKYPQGFHRERRRKYPHRKFPFIPPGKSRGNFCRDDPLEFPHKSGWKPGGRGWLARWALRMIRTQCVQFQHHIAPKVILQVE